MNELERTLDAQAHAAWARAWLGLSPESNLLAWVNWVSHLAVSPGKRGQLTRLAMEQASELIQGLPDAVAFGGLRQKVPEAAGAANDRRFADPAWGVPPFDLMRRAFQMQSDWWEEATQGVWGVNQHHQQLVAFGARQWLDLFSPGNQLLTNPVVLERTLQESGANLARGTNYLLDDLNRHFNDQPPPGSEQFEVGRDVAVTPGKVVLRNRLIELIQYTPTTEQVYPEPILIVPAWIMKYYILDLSPHNSLVKYLVDQGHTVFCVSWKNPGADERGLGMDDYLSLGIEAALEAIGAIVPGRQIHATGYCLGGTLLSIAAAAMARDGDQRLASLSLFTAQTDFSEPGELALFIDESQLALLEAQMDAVGYLRADQMSGAFQMLRSYDLLWSRIVNEYLLGERRPLNDLMAWNADATRMPARMHGQYLRRLFLDNDLAKGRYPVQGCAVSLRDVSLPIFGVGTVRDHVAPWRSVYKLHQLTTAELTFVLASGGHNAGIVSEPGHPRRSYQVATRAAGETASLSPDEWVAQASGREGSWWVEWLAWLKQRSGDPVRPPRLGARSKGYPALESAPGQYVKER